MNNFIKRFFVLLLILIAFSSAATASMDLEEAAVLLKKVTLQINDHRELPIKAMVYEDHLYLPLRFIAEKLNNNVLWDEENSTVTIKGNGQFYDFDEADPLNNERFVYGQIMKINRDQRIITVEEHIDDNSMNIEPDLKISEDVIIILQRNDNKMNISFEDLRVGDIIGLVLNKNNVVRGIILNE